MMRILSSTTKTTQVANDDLQSSVVSFDITLFIRLLEIAREEISSDEELHQLAERCSEQAASKGKPLTMDDYPLLASREQASIKTTAAPVGSVTYTLDRLKTLLQEDDLSTVRDNPTVWVAKEILRRQYSEDLIWIFGYAGTVEHVILTTKNGEVLADYLEKMGRFDKVSKTYTRKGYDKDSLDMDTLAVVKAGKVLF